jgi:hypothetical protein
VALDAAKPQSNDKETVYGRHPRRHPNGIAVYSFRENTRAICVEPGVKMVLSQFVHLENHTNVWDCCPNVPEHNEESTKQDKNEF